MKKKPLLPAMLPWLTCFLTMTACGALWSVGGCTGGYYGQPSTLTQGTAVGALIGLLCAWLTAVIIYARPSNIAVPKKEDWQ